MDNNQAVVVYGGSSRRSGEGSTRKPPENLHRGTVLMVLLLGAFVTILNQTLLNVAISTFPPIRFNGCQQDTC